MDLRPPDASAVATAVRDLRAAGGRCVVSGGGTLMDVCEPDPDAPRLDTRGLSGVVAYEPADLTCTVGAGMTLAELQRLLGASGQALPVWHPAPERATVGGLVGFGWTGLGRSHYGRLRDRVLEVHVVTGEAKRIRGGGKVVKNVTGFDLPRLFCGSLGTLGVIVELTLKVAPEPAALHATTREGEDPAELLEGPTPPPTYLTTHNGGWRSFAFAPGPRADAEVILGASAPVATESFERLATDPIMAPDTDPATPAVVCRVAVPPSALSGVLRSCAPVSRAIVDVTAGVGWLGFDDSGPVTALRRDAEACGGSAVLLKAAADVRASIGTWGSPPAGAEIAGRLKRQFDPDSVFGTAGLPISAADASGR